MKKSYLFILIGTILAFIYIGIGLLDFFNHVIGYILIILGVYYLNQNKNRHHELLTLSQYLTIGLLCFELLKGGILRVIGNQAITAFFVILLIMIIRSLVFYLIIKVEGDTSESLTVQTYQQTTLLLSIGSILFYIISCFIPSAITLFTMIDLVLHTFLIYAFYQIRDMYRF